MIQSYLQVVAITAINTKKRKYLLTALKLEKIAWTSFINISGHNKNVVGTGPSDSFNLRDFYVSPSAHNKLPKFDLLTDFNNVNCKTFLCIYFSKNVLGIILQCP